MLERTLAENIHQIVMPCMEKLRKSRPTEPQRLLLDMLEARLKEIVTPFPGKTMVASFLSPAELRVAGCIRQGRSSNEIARALGTSKSAVLFHRKNIRHKLGLTGKKINLSSYLSDTGKW
ncbi:MAG: response regulator transcription factor [Syntrophobacteraceae bacterium]